MSFDVITLPDGQQFGTGLLVPATTAASFPEYATVGPMMSMDDIVAAAKSGKFRGFDKFDSTWVKDQKTHGSCNGFAEASALSKARVRRLGIANRVDLSGAYAYSLINGGSDRGSTLDDGMAASEAKGICPESMCGWDDIYPSRYDKPKCDAAAANYKSFECYAVRTEIELFSALANNFDCVVAVHVGSKFSSMDANGVAGYDNGPGNHAVHADGCFYEDSEGLIADYQNSWGLTIHNKGRAGLTWKKHFHITTQYHPFYAMRSTSDGTAPIPPVAHV